MSKRLSEKELYEISVKGLVYFIVSSSSIILGKFWSECRGLLFPKIHSLISLKSDILLHNGLKYPNGLLPRGLSLRGRGNAKLA